MSRRSFARVVSPIVASALFIAVVSVVAGPQEKPKSAVPRAEKARPAPPEPPPPAGETDEQQKAVAKADKLIAAYDLKPHGLPTIPDDPPPHEGAMISLPNIVEPPDLILVEVLEALPGRPISGERMVRPDGTISLGFYGDINVKGLTVPQIKVAVIKRLRQFLPYDTLGLISNPEDEALQEPTFEDPPKARTPDIPEVPEGRNPFEAIEKPQPAPDRPHSAKARSSSRPTLRRHIPLRRVRTRGKRVEAQDQTGPDKGKRSSKVPPPPPIMEPEDSWQVIPPEESLCVYVDITAYNSKNYYILGDVLVPGKLPWTGNETVLDALQYASGLLPTAEPKDIELIRPGGGGKPAKVYKVDLAAIQDKGDVRSNYQLFPGDRLVVGRNEVVKKTIEIDRLEAPIDSIAGSIQRIANSIRAVQTINPANADAIVKELVDFWAKEISRKGDLKLDEATLREALLQKQKAAAPAPEPKKQP